MHMSSAPRDARSSLLVTKTARAIAEKLGNQIGPDKNHVSNIVTQLITIYLLAKFGVILRFRAFWSSLGSPLLLLSTCARALLPWQCHELQVLLATLLDSWEVMRVAAATALTALATPLPGYTTPAAVCRLVTWAKGLLCSPRPHEADAGARVVALVHSAFVAKLGWRVTLEPAVAVQLPLEGGRQGSEGGGQGGEGGRQGGEGMGSPSDGLALTAQLQLVSSMVDGLEAGVQRGRLDMVAACRESFLQGRLLALRYVTEAIPWLAVLQIDALVRSGHTSGLRCTSPL